MSVSTVSYWVHESWCQSRGIVGELHTADTEPAMMRAPQPASKLTLSPGGLASKTKRMRPSSSSQFSGQADISAQQGCSSGKSNAAHGEPRPAPALGLGHGVRCSCPLIPADRRRTSVSFSSGGTLSRCPGPARDGTKVRGCPPSSLARNLPTQLTAAYVPPVPLARLHRHSALRWLGDHDVSFPSLPKLTAGGQQ